MRKIVEALTRPFAASRKRREPPPVSSALPFWKTPASEAEKIRLIEHEWPHQVPFALEFDLGPIRSLGFERIQALAEAFEVNCGRTPARYITTKSAPTAHDPDRQLLTVSRANKLRTSVVIDGHTAFLALARHRLVGRRETTLDFTQLLQVAPTTLDGRRRVG